MQLVPLPCQKDASPPALRISRSPLRTPSSAIGRRTPMGGPTCMSVLSRSSGAVAVREAMPASPPEIRTTAGLGSVSALSCGDGVAASWANGSAGSAGSAIGEAGVADRGWSLSDSRSVSDIPCETVAVGDNRCLCCRFVSLDSRWFVPLPVSKPRWLQASAWRSGSSPPVQVASGCKRWRTADCAHDARAVSRASRPAGGSKRPDDALSCLTCPSWLWAAAMAACIHAVTMNGVNV